MVIPSIVAIAAALGMIVALLYRLHAFRQHAEEIAEAFRQPAEEIAEADGCTERQLDEDTYFCYTPTPERVGEIRRRLEVKDEAERSQRP